MGFVSAVVFNNDQIDQVKNDPEAGNKIYHAIMSLNARSGPVNAGHGATAIACHHASTGIPVLIGGGLFFQVIKDIHVSEGEPDKELALLKRLAEKHGYNLHRKRK